MFGNKIEISRPDEGGGGRREEGGRRRSREEGGGRKEEESGGRSLVTKLRFHDQTREEGRGGRRAPGQKS